MLLCTAHVIGAPRGYYCTPRHTRASTDLYLTVRKCSLPKVLVPLKKTTHIPKMFNCQLKTNNNNIDCLQTDETLLPPENKETKSLKNQRCFKTAFPELSEPIFIGHQFAEHICLTILKY